jgi:hypothetical protein
MANVIVAYVVPVIHVFACLSDRRRPAADGEGADMGAVFGGGPDALRLGRRRQPADKLDRHRDAFMITSLILSYARVGRWPAESHPHRLAAPPAPTRRSPRPAGAERRCTRAHRSRPGVDSRCAGADRHGSGVDPGRAEGPTRLCSLPRTLRGRARTRGTAPGQ